MNLKLLVISALSAIYAILCALGIMGIHALLGGLVYYLFAAIVLIYTCVLVFSRIAATSVGLADAAFAGALALGAFALDMVYTAVYLFIYRGEPADITIVYYSRNCAFLFLSAAVLMLVRPPGTWTQWFKIVLNLIFATVIIVTILSVITLDLSLLLISYLLVILLCAAPAAYALFQSLKTDYLKSARLFASLVLVLSLLEAGRRIMKFFDSELLLRDLFLSLYPPAYFLLGIAIIRLAQARPLMAQTRPRLSQTPPREKGEDANG